MNIIPNRHENCKGEGEQFGGMGKILSGYAKDAPSPSDKDTAHPHENSMKRIICGWVILMC